MALTTDREKCAHLLRRFGLGASESEVDYYLSGGSIANAVDRLIDYEKVPEGIDIPIDSIRSKNDALNMSQLVSWWATRMICTQRPLQEKMTLFWHDHFATSAEKVNRPFMMYAQNEILRKNATGSFRTLLSEVSKDPAMLLWLDNQDNVKGKPNENFAREVMELFTLGIGHYTEDDVQNGARAFTGWAFKRGEKVGSGKKGNTAEFADFAEKHDDGEKTFLGQKGTFDGDDILRILCDQPHCSVFLTSKILNWFCYQDPEPAVVDKFAAIFKASDLNIKTLLKAIMLSDEFYSARAERSVIKNPVDFCVATARQLGVGSSVSANLNKPGKTNDAIRNAMHPALMVAQAMKSMGMYIFYPPDVDGWKSQDYWISSGTMVERMKWAGNVFKNINGRVIFGNQPTAQEYVDKLISIFDANIPESKMPALIAASQKLIDDPNTGKDTAKVAGAIARLMYGTPEFQFS